MHSVTFITNTTNGYISLNGLFDLAFIFSEKKKSYRSATNFNSFKTCILSFCFSTSAAIDEFCNQISKAELFLCFLLLVFAEFDE